MSCSLQFKIVASSLRTYPFRSAELESLERMRFNAARDVLLSGRLEFNRSHYVLNFDNQTRHNHMLPSVFASTPHWLFRGVVLRANLCLSQSDSTWYSLFIYIFQAVPLNGEPLYPRWRAFYLNAYYVIASTHPLSILIGYSTTTKSGLCLSNRRRDLTLSITHAISSTLQGKGVREVEKIVKRGTHSKGRVDKRRQKAIGPIRFVCSQLFFVFFESFLWISLSLSLKFTF